MKKWQTYFFIATFAALLAGLYYGDKIFFMAFIVFACIIVYALLYNIIILATFKYTQSITPPSTSKGQTSTLNITIYNNSPLLIPYIKIIFKTPEYPLKGRFMETTKYLMPFKHLSINKNITCNTRGKYPIGIVEIQVSDIFGLFIFKKKLSEKDYSNEMFLTIYPRVLQLPKLPINPIDMKGLYNKGILATDESVTTSDIREYQCGDPLKTIHWKISAKFLDIYVKNFETSSQPQVLMFMDMQHFDLIPIWKYEIEDQIIECSLSIINYLLKQNISINAIMYNKNRQSIQGRNMKNFESFFYLLSFIPFEGIFPMEQVLRMEKSLINRGQVIILILYKMDHNLYNYVCILKQYGIDITVFLIYHPQYANKEQSYMIEKLNARYIPSFMICTDNRLDKIMEASL